MKTLITEFISLDGVVQAPGGPEETAKAKTGSQVCRYARVR